MPLQMVDMEGHKVWGFFQEDSTARLQRSTGAETELFSSEEKKKQQGQGRETDEGEKKNTFVIQYKEPKYFGNRFAISQLNMRQHDCAFIAP